MTFMSGTATCARAAAATIRSFTEILTPPTALRSSRSASRSSTRARPRIVKTGVSRALSASRAAIARRIRECGIES